MLKKFSQKRQIKEGAGVNQVKGENVSGCGDSRREELEEVRKPMVGLQIRVPPPHRCRQKHPSG